MASKNSNCGRVSKNIGRQSALGKSEGDDGVKILVNDCTIEINRIRMRAREPISQYVQWQCNHEGNGRE